MMQSDVIIDSNGDYFDAKCKTKLEASEIMLDQLNLSWSQPLPSMDAAIYQIHNRKHASSKSVVDLLIVVLHKKINEKIISPLSTNFYL